MKAFSYDQFGGLEVLHASTPPAPETGPNDVLVTIEARSINIIDIRVRRGMLGPLVSKKFPKVPGADFAGTVASVGANVTAFAPGDRVFGAADPFKGGAFAEMIAVPAGQVARLGVMTAVQGAALPIAGLAALLSMRDLGKVAQGQDVLIHGATGPVGLAAVQIAKLLGAHVTAVGGAGMETARRLGADAVFDYRSGNTLEKGKRFDVILNASGKMPYDIGKTLLKPSGKLIEPSPTIPIFIGSKIANLFRRRKHLVLATQVRSADLEYLQGLVINGQFEPVISATYDFGDAIAAFSQVERGGVAGKVVVTS